MIFLVDTKHQRVKIFYNATLKCVASLSIEKFEILMIRFCKCYQFSRLFFMVLRGPNTETL